jgi:hypothetical protein
MRKLTKYLSNDLYAVLLFSGIGLLVSLIAVFCNERGLWF